MGVRVYKGLGIVPWRMFYFILIIVSWGMTKTNISIKGLGRLMSFV